MKKLLFLLGSFIFTSFITMNETSCFCNRDKEKPYDSVVNKISAAQNICLRDDSDDASVTKETDKTAILNQIGLTSQEQSYVIGLSGTLTVDTPSTITFQISKSPNSAVIYTEIDNQVTLQQVNKLNNVMISGISDARNLALINNRQLIIAGITGNGTYISDTNLNFVNTSTVDDGCGGSPNWVSVYNNDLYLSVSACSLPFVEKHILTLDNDDYYPPTTRTDIDCAIPRRTTVSNNILYINTINENEWIVNSDDTATQITNSSETKEKTNCICNINNTLYVGTTNGLYKSTDGGATWILNTTISTSVNIDAMIASDDGKEIFAASAADLYVSTDDGQTFTNMNVGTPLNVFSLFISKNNNLYFSNTNLGLKKVALSDLTNVQPVVSTHISASDNVKNITQTADGTILVLTNNNVVYLQE